MIKLKKAVSTILTATLVGAMLSSTLVFPSYADGDDSETKSEETTSTETTAAEKYITSFSFDANLVFIKNATIPNTEFTFTMTPKEVDTGATRNNHPKETGIALPADDATITVEFTGNDTSQKYNSEYDEIVKELEFNLSNVNYGTSTASGYRYYVYQIEQKTTDNTDYIEYGYLNSAKKYEDVEVLVNNQGKIVSVAAYTSDDGKETKSDIAFTSRCKSTTITVLKEFSGTGINEDDYDKEFVFTFEIPESGDAYGTGGNLTIATGTTFTYTIVSGTESTSDKISIGTPKEFKLKEGDVLTVTGVPIGMVYQVTETNNQGFDSCIINYRKVVEKVTGDYGYDTYKKTDTIACNSKTVSADNKVTFTNIKNTPDAGIRIDIAPYALACLVVLGGVILLFVRKRRNEEE